MLDAALLAAAPAGRFATRFDDIADGVSALGRAANSEFTDRFLRLHFDEIGSIGRRNSDALLKQIDLSSLSRSQQNAIRSLQQRIIEHRQKLADYRANPDRFDNRNFLKNAPNDEVRRSIISGRIRGLESEIKTFESQIQEILSNRGDK